MDNVRSTDIALVKGNVFERIIRCGFKSYKDADVPVRGYFVVDLLEERFVCVPSRTGLDLVPIEAIEDRIVGFRRNFFFDNPGESYLLQATIVRAYRNFLLGKPGYYDVAKKLNPLRVDDAFVYLMMSKHLMYPENFSGANIIELTKDFFGFRRVL